MVVILYYANWTLYRNHTPLCLMPILSSLTHLYYAFVSIDLENNTVKWSDSWADLEHPTTLEDGSSVTGNIGLFHWMIKNHASHLKLGLSLGGWGNGSDLLRQLQAQPQRIAAFAENVVSFMLQYGFHILDIDEEYPQSREEGEQLLALISAIFKVMQVRAPFLEITMACPASQEFAQYFPLTALQRLVTRFLLMTYDMAGCNWSNEISHQAPLYGPGLNIFDTVKYYQQFISSEKLVLGIPLYARGFVPKQTLSQPLALIGKEHTGAGGPGSYESGIYLLKDCEKGMTQLDKSRVAACTLKDGIWLTHETFETLQLKIQYLRQVNLGGVMFWESSGDLSSKSLIQEAARLL